jgi:hypothetical protein
MRYKITLAAACLALSTLTLPAASQAAAVAPAQSPMVKDYSAVETVQWRRRGYNRCRAWRYECASRWGWGTWRMRRCMRLHGCW